MVHSVHPLIHEAKRQAEKLRRYCIMPTYSGVMVWRFTDQWQWDQRAAEKGRPRESAPPCSAKPK